LPEYFRVRLDQFLKWQGVVGTGGEAKLRIQQWEVQVNGVVEERRGRQLQPGDRVEFQGLSLPVQLAPAEGQPPTT
jgi:ribosome-associated protein